MYVWILSNQKSLKDKTRPSIQDRLPKAIKDFESVRKDIDNDFVIDKTLKKERRRKEKREIPRSFILCESVQRIQISVTEQHSYIILPQYFIEKYPSSPKNYEVDKSSFPA